MTALTFPVLSKPVGQGNHRVNAWGAIYETSRNHGEWRTAVTYAAKSAMRRASWFTCEGPCILDVTFFLHEPKKPKFVVPAVVPDTSKLIRSTEDALTDAGVWKDDSLVVEIHAYKRYCDEDFTDPGAWIQVQPWAVGGEAA